MKLKKIVAREFLIFVAATGICAIFYFVLVLRNNYYQSNLFEAKRNIRAAQISIDSLETQFSFIYDELGIPVRPIPGVKFPDGFGELPPTNAVDTLLMLETQIRTQMDVLKVTEDKIMYQPKILENLKLCFLFVFGILFPLRYFIYTLIWAVKTIRS